MRLKLGTVFGLLNFLIWSDKPKEIWLVIRISNSIFFVFLESFSSKFSSLAHYQLPIKHIFNIFYSFGYDGDNLWGWSPKQFFLLSCKIWGPFVAPTVEKFAHQWQFAMSLTLQVLDIRYMYTIPFPGLRPILLLMSSEWKSVVQTATGQQKDAGEHQPVRQSKQSDKRQDFVTSWNGWGGWLVSLPFRPRRRVLRANGAWRWLTFPLFALRAVQTSKPSKPPHYSGKKRRGESFRLLAPADTKRKSEARSLRGA